MFDVVIGIWCLIWVLNIAGFAWVTYDVIKKQKLMPESERLIWIFMAFLFGSFVAIVYALPIKLSGKYKEVELEGSEGVRVW
ncbi:hypothetical protein X802_05200 [Thermococcus guaymasensis DSM 11113]|uniref:Cardiolipin synthase N-terminal domain-containing protein n=1 Tax=Thermococcus guaymasensis DSM 11113 TaxID=1432656 RepID=A0A0X1KK52_9EURY|nr:hypothetical protein [Thermococcus guaymasensis]AJC71636.1 hypothetical protein X802_05200 [Thermococcus guaymasensis DSM 11113]